jgi:very-short-patch-repair endonuclease
LAARQHGVVSAQQLAGVGLSRRAIQHRIARGRLHPVMRGVYAVGRPELARQGWWMAAVLCCSNGAIGPGDHEDRRVPGDPGGRTVPVAGLSHRSAAALWGFGEETGGAIDVSTRSWSRLRRPGIRVHRRPGLEPRDLTICDGIPVTAPVRTLVDFASQVRRAALERAVNEADMLDLVDPETLRGSLDRFRGQRGVGRLRDLLDRRTFRLTDSELERRFLRLAAAAGLPTPETQSRLNGYRVDFHWPKLGLVVETDGLRYHRTAAQQARDHVRDQAHTAAGLTPLRFTHAQVRFDPEHVRATLTAVAGRLGGARHDRGGRPS